MGAPQTTPTTTLRKKTHVAAITAIVHSVLEELNVPPNHPKWADAMKKATIGAEIAYAILNEL